jgi:hypothetical protein
MICVGIDIGKQGGISVMDKDGSHVSVIPMPMIGTELDLLELNILFKSWGHVKCHIVFEKLGVIFGSSKTTARSMGLQEGAMEAFCAAYSIPFTKVPPKTWQKEMFEGLTEMKRSDGKRDTKAMALVIAKRLFPTVSLLATEKSKVPHDGIVDALLLSEYCRRHY